MTQAANTCVRCGTTYGSQEMVCLIDGHPLSVIDLTGQAPTTLLTSPASSMSATTAPFSIPSGRHSSIELQTPVKKSTQPAGPIITPRIAAAGTGVLLLACVAFFWLGSRTVPTPVAASPAPTSPPIAEEALSGSETAQAEIQAPVNANSTPSSTSEQDIIEAQISRWQEVKRKAYLDKDISALESVLTEPALSIRREGVAYWQKSITRYYRSLSLHSIQIKSIELQDETSAVAEVAVKESHDTSEGNKEVDGIFRYSLQKIGAQWLISNIQEID